MGKKERKAKPPAPARSVYPSRWKAGAFLVLAMALFAAAVLLYQESAPAEAADTAGANEVRFAELRQVLPPHATVGYVSDIGGAGFSRSGAYYLAQYALAPALLDPGVNHEWIVGNFSSPAAIEAALREKHLAPARDFGNGVLLLRKAAR
jgi:hypothetical protein